MSKTLLRMLAIAMLMFAGLGQPFNHPQAFPADANNLSPEVENSSTTVEVTFDGLMVFEKVAAPYEHYEVGVIARDDHKFKAIPGKQKNNRETRKRDKEMSNLITQLTAGNEPLILEVISDDGTPKPPNIWARQRKGCDRLRDTKAGEDSNHASDFCWIMDLEREFHGGHELKLIEGKLKPIIWLKHGELYTKYKYDELERQQQPHDVTQKPSWDAMSRFGFVAQTLALRVNLQKGEHLVLRNSKGELFRLSTEDGVLSAAILNAPLKAYPMTMKHGVREPSHFLYYYDLFDQIKDGEKVDIARKEGGLRPLNRWISHRTFDDDFRKATWDQEACGSAFLGIRRTGLK